MNVRAVPNLFEQETDVNVADLYLDKDKLKGWSMSQHQSMTGFEKIRVVGKGEVWRDLVELNAKRIFSLSFVKVLLEQLCYTERKMTIPLSF